jgi:polysaccharide biosynthesis protein PslH
MKILMLTLYLPYPPTSGGQIRSYNLIKHLSKKHEITLFSLIKKGEEKYAPELEKYCKEVIYFYRPDKPWTLQNILKTGFSLFPFLVIRNLSSAGRQALAAKIKKEKFDLIHVETFYLRPHIPETKIPMVLVDQTIEFRVYQHHTETMKWWFLKPLFYIDVLKLRYWETRFWREAARVVAVSEADAQTMRELVPGLKADIIPNAPGDDLSSVFRERKAPNVEKPIIFYQSNFFWMQNVEGGEILIKDVFPAIRKQVPGAICRVVGQKAREKIGQLAGSGVEVIDLETSDIDGIRKAYREGTVFVAPLWGPGGTRLKILSAMSTGVPVVTTPVGAQGIDVTSGKDILIGETSEELAGHVARLLSDKKLYSEIVKNARKLIESKYDWKSIADNLNTIYEETARG